MLGNSIAERFTTPTSPAATAILTAAVAAPGPNIATAGTDNVIAVGMNTMKFL